jgi:hypothetical protein
MTARRKTAKPRKGRTDWARINKLTDAEIEQIAANDADNPATSEDDWVQAKSACRH